LSDEIDESKTEENRVARTEQFSLRALKELQTLLRHARRSEAEVPAPRVKVLNDGKSQQLAPDYPDVANGCWEARVRISSAVFFASWRAPRRRENRLVRAT
jgi:hypothetical protein